MKGRKPTAAEQRHMDRVRALGCICCLNMGYDTPAAIHHVAGKTKAGAHYMVLPLCYHHHQGLPDSRHGNKTAFEKKHGTEGELLKQIADISANIEDLDPEYSKLISEHFWELI